MRKVRSDLLFDMTFYVDQRVKHRNEVSEQHLTSVIFY